MESTISGPIPDEFWVAWEESAHPELKVGHENLTIRKEEPLLVADLKYARHASELRRPGQFIDVFWLSPPSHGKKNRKALCCTEYEGVERIVPTPRIAP